MAPSKSDLVKAGREGFAMLDEYFGQQQQQQYVHKFQRQPQKPHVVQVIVPDPVSVAKEKVRIDCYEAAKVYNGTVIVHYPKAKNTPYA